jgi:hypothetical protein
MFTSKETVTLREIKPDQKQINIPADGQLSKKGTVIKNTKFADEVDYSIADIVESINKAGFISKFSCSGIKKDHPLKGVNYDGGYISFFHHDNDRNALAFIEKAAQSLHLTAEYCSISQLPALTIRIDKDKAGNSLSDRIRLANEIKNKSVSCVSMNSFGAFTKDLDSVIKKSGGLIYDSDEKIESVWRRFCDLLLNFSYQNAS